MNKETMRSSLHLRLIKNQDMQLALLLNMVEQVVQQQLQLQKK